LIGRRAVTSSRLTNSLRALTAAVRSDILNSYEIFLHTVLGRHFLHLLRGAFDNK
jgi:hypothetical protein